MRLFSFIFPRKNLALLWKRTNTNFKNIFEKENSYEKA